MDHRHAGLIGELPEVLRPAPDADLNDALGVEHAVEHRLPEGPAVMEFRALVGAGRVTMGVDVDHADRAPGADRPEDRIGDRMIPADRQRRDAGLDDRAEGRLDILVAAFQRVAGAEGHVADVGRLDHAERRRAEDMVHGPDALDGAHRARPEPRAGAIGHAQIHRQADDGDVEPAEVRLGQRIGPVGSTDEGRDVGEGPFAPVALELVGRDLGEARIVNVAAARPGVARPKLPELVLIH